MNLKINSTTIIRDSFWSQKTTTQSFVIVISPSFIFIKKEEAKGHEWCLGLSNSVRTYTKRFTQPLGFTQFESRHVVEVHEDTHDEHKHIQTKITRTNQFCKIPNSIINHFIHDNSFTGKF